MSRQEKWHVINWTIENFSYWNDQVHGNFILLDNDVFYRFLKLYPRGLDAKGRNIVVCIHGETEPFYGDLSFIGPGKSLICHRQIRQVENEGVFILPDGPEHTAVVSLLRKNEGKDQLTLRCRLKSEYNVVNNFHTTIDVLNMSMNIPAEIIRAIPFREEEIFLLSYPHNDCKSGINLYLFKDGLENQHALVKWALRPLALSDGLLLDLTVSVLNRNGEPVRSYTDSLEFYNNFKFTLEDSMSLDEVRKEYSLCFHLTLFLGNNVKSYGYHSFNCGFDPEAFRLSSINTSANHFKLMMTSSSHEETPRRAVASKHTMTDDPPEDLASSTPEHVQEENSPDDAIAPEDEKTVLSRDLMCLYQDQDFSDFEIRCGKVSFATHKSILSARSPVFKTMLLSNMAEATSGVAEVLDLDVPTLGRFLTFLYTGTVDELLQCEDALRLYYAANKYQVLTLEKVCSSVMCSSVSVSNVCEILSLADKHQDEELTTAARDFILKNYNEVLKSEEWKSFMTTDPVTLLKTVTYFAEQDCVVKKSSQ